MNRLKERVAVVTGGLSGLGFATVLRFLEEGAVVCVLDRRDTAPEEKQAQLERAGGAYRLFAVDITDRASVGAVYEAIWAEFGRIDVLVNCAGNMAPHGMPDACDEAQERVARRVMEVNTFGANNCASEVIRYMRRSRGGSLIFIGSLSAMLVYPGDWAYIASKSAVMGLAREYAVAYGPDGIRSNCILPSAVNTEGAVASLMEGGVKPEDIQELSNPLRHPITPRDIANAAVFFASEDALAVSGQTLAVDGALSVSFPAGVY